MTDTSRLVTPTIFQGDNLSMLRELAPWILELGGISLAYLDPPFCSQRDYTMPDGAVAFGDRWASMADYVAALRERIFELRELLAPHGCLVLHVDPKTSHYLKVMGDEVFGPECFASEIVWRYRRWPSKTPNFQRVHDVLLRWVRMPGFQRWNQLYEPLAPSTLKTWGTGRQRALFDDSGRRRLSSTDGTASPGVSLGDVWEIPIIAPASKERTGYPTQKPEALLERLVLACTDPGDLVLDPCMGSGTTLAVAARLDRSAIGIDISPEAVRVARHRLFGDNQ